MVFMTMGNHQTANAGFIRFQIAEVRNDHVNAVHIVFRETHAAVNQQDIFSVLNGGDVFSDFTQTAQRDNFQF